MNWQIETTAFRPATERRVAKVTFPGGDIRVTVQDCAGAVAALENQPTLRAPPYGGCVAVHVNGSICWVPPAVADRAAEIIGRHAEALAAELTSLQEARRG